MDDKEPIVTTRFLSAALHVLGEQYATKAAGHGPHWADFIRHLAAAERAFLKLDGERGETWVVELTTHFKELEVAEQDFERAAEWRAVADTVRKLTKK